MKATGIAFLTCLVCGASAAEAAEACALQHEHEVRIVRAVDAETVELADERQVRLINMLPPRRPLWLAKDKPWPAADKAQRMLVSLVQGKTAVLAFDERREDRHQRLLAQVFVMRDGQRVWVQGEMVAKGWARVWSLPSSRTCVPALLPLEKAARSGKLGLWRQSFYRVRPALPGGDLIKLKNAFAIVEGKVLRVAGVGSRIFLNFEEDWRQDFTVVVTRSSAQLFDGADEGLNSLEGSRIRVRGWMETYNGPMMHVTHPEQIELLDE